MSGATTCCGPTRTLTRSCVWLPRIAVSPILLSCIDGCPASLRLRGAGYDQGVLGQTAKPNKDIGFDLLTTLCCLDAVGLHVLDASVFTLFWFEVEHVQLSMFVYSDYVWEPFSDSLNLFSYHVEHVTNVFVCNFGFKCVRGVCAPTQQPTTAHTRSTFYTNVSICTNVLAYP